jgi:hypothetical protein
LGFIIFSQMLLISITGGVVYFLSKDWALMFSLLH